MLLGVLVLVACYLVGLGGEGAGDYYGGCVSDVVKAVIGTWTRVTGEVECVGVEVEGVAEILIGMCDDLVRSGYTGHLSLSS